MSAIFLVSFAAQICIHNTIVAYIASIGILAAPSYFVTLYESVTTGGVFEKIEQIPMSFLYHWPQYVVRSTEFENAYFSKETVVFQWYPEKLKFLGLIILAAVAVIALAVRMKWMIRQTNNSIVSSIVVMEFVLSGLFLCAGTGIAVFTGNLPIHSGNHRHYYSEEFKFWAISILFAVILLLAANIGIVLKRKRRKESR